MIRGELVDLRSIERTDAPTVHGWLNDPAVMRGWGDSAPATSQSAVQQQIEGWLDEEHVQGRPSALVIDTPTGDPLGLVVLRSGRPEVREVELSLLIGDAERWGQGLGTDAVQTVLDACFGGWNLHRVWLRSETWNVRAHRLYERCGFRQEGVLRQAAFLDGRYEDVVLFGLLAEEWAQTSDS
jgi:RimJ/RimL family protein N-acetyltransferase